MRYSDRFTIADSQAAQAAHQTLTIHQMEIQPMSQTMTAMMKDPLLKT
jgi:hypothetical protein